MFFNNRVFKNASWIIMCRIAQMIINLVVGMLSARYLGPDNYGLINYACSVVSFALPIMQLGLTSILVHELVQHPEDEGEILGTSILMSGISAVVCFFGVIAFSVVANAGEKETIIVCALASVSLFFQAMEVIIYWFQTKLMSKYTSVLMFAVYVVIAIYKILLLVTEKKIYWFAIAMAIQEMLVAVGCIAIYRKKGGKPFSWSISRAKLLFSHSYHYIISALMVTLFVQTDKVMIKIMLDSAATGFYSCAANCVSMTNFVFAAIIDSMRPAILESKKEGKQSYEKSIALLYCIIIYLSLAQSVGMSLLAKPIITILYGKAYIFAIPTLQILVWNSIFSYIGAVRNIWILAEQKQKYLWIINLMGALANVILNYIMIPIWGINGAAFASVLTQLITNIIISHLIKPIRENTRIMLMGLNLKNNIKDYLK